MTDSISLDSRPGSVRDARRWSRERTRLIGCPELVDTAELLVSELVTNAVLHAAGPYELRMVDEADAVRFEVIDGSDALPASRGRTDQFAESGRGMHLVEELASDHGARRLPDGGKAVWFRLRRTPFP